MKKPIFFRIFALILIGLGFSAAYFWYYALAPMRRTLDPAWFALHSEEAYWNEVQKSILRGIWLHDHGLIVGLYGDADWAEWIFTRLTPGDDLGCHGGKFAHAETALAYMTNRSMDYEPEFWLEWWELNQSKTQLDWVLDGFKQEGIEITFPPTNKEISVLLKILGSKEENTYGKYPRHLTFNAMRLLRDSGFNPVQYALENPSPPEDIQQGLLTYSEMASPRFTNSAPGSLQDTSEIEAGAPTTMPPALINTKRFQFKANVMIFGLPILGLALLRKSMP